MRLVQPVDTALGPAVTSTLVEMIWPSQLNLDAHQGDRVVGDEVPDHDRCRDEGAGRNQDPVVGPVGIGLR